MPNQFLSPDGDLENYFVTEYWLIDQYIGDELWIWGNSGYGGNPGDQGTSKSIGNSIPVTTFAGGTNWKQVSLGKAHSAAIKTDGTLWMWGYNADGELGIANLLNKSTPVTTFAGGTDWNYVATTGFGTLAIKTDGTLWTWGYKGITGSGSTVDRISTPVTTFAGGSNWKQVAGGDYHAAGVKTDGTLWLWGRAVESQLGNGNNFGPISTPVTTFAGGTNWKQVACGGFHTAAVKTNGTLWTWGFNGFSSGYDGQLGINEGGNNRSTPITTFVGGTDWKQVCCGANHVAAIKTNGTLWTWGNSTYGQLGNGPLRKRYTPVTTFAGGTNWRDTATGAAEELYTLTSGGGFNAAIKTDGTLWVWGSGSQGQLGNNKTSNRSTPVTTFAGGTNWKQVHMNESNAAAIKTDGTLWVWGSNGNAQLGINATGNRSTPVTTFAGGTNWKQVSCGSNHIASIKTDGTLWVWGFNLNGQLGTNDISNRSTPVTTFAGGTNWKQLSCGRTRTTAIKTDGTLWSWGNNSVGQLGTNDTNSRSTPVTTFAGGTNWKQVSSENYSTSTAIKTDGTLWTWGYGGYGELGNETFNNVYTPITTFAGGTNWKQVHSGGSNVIALQDDGVNKRLYLFGSNYNDCDLGLGTVDGYIPREVAGNHTNWKQVDAGYGNTAAIKTDGTLWTWGYNSKGQLGNDSVISYQYKVYTPVTTFAGGTNWRQVNHSNRTHIAAVKTGISPDLPLS